MQAAISELSPDAEATPLHQLAARGEVKRPTTAGAKTEDSILTQALRRGNLDPVDSLGRTPLM